MDSKTSKTQFYLDDCLNAMHMYAMQAAAGAHGNWATWTCTAEVAGKLADEIERLQRELADAQASYHHWHKIAVDLKYPDTVSPDETFDRNRFEQAPCYLCGYNGEGYYQPAIHRCASRYHRGAEETSDRPAYSGGTDSSADPRYNK